MDIFIGHNPRRGWYASRPNPADINLFPIDCSNYQSRLYLYRDMLWRTAAIVRLDCETGLIVELSAYYEVPRELAEDVIKAAHILLDQDVNPFVIMPVQLIPSFEPHLQDAIRKWGERNA